MAYLEIKNLLINSDSSTIVDLLQELKSSIKIESSLALVGQSGSGKSLTLKSILGMLPQNLHDTLEFESDFDLDKSTVGFIPQNPFTSLSPMTKVNKQFFDINNNYFSKEKLDSLFEMVGLDKELQFKFPVELSGGQLQRIVIAIALSNNPKLLLLDEPTTALDDQSKQNILNLLMKLQNELGFIFIFVSHDIESVKNVCKNIAILNHGSICEYGSVETILNEPSHPYTKELLNSNFGNREFRV